MRQTVKFAPTLGAKSSRSTPSRASGPRAASAIQPSSLNVAPNPATVCRGRSVCTNTSGGPASSLTASSPRRHDAVCVVTTHSTPVDCDVSIIRPPDLYLVQALRPIHDPDNDRRALPLRRGGRDGHLPRPGGTDDREGASLEGGVRRVGEPLLRGRPGAPEPLQGGGTGD